MIVIKSWKPESDAAHAIHLHNALTRGKWNPDVVPFPNGVAIVGPSLEILAVFERQPVMEAVRKAAMQFLPDPEIDRI